MHQLIISRLIEAGYQVFIPIGEGSELIVRDSSGELRRCEARNASIDGENSPVLRVSGRGFDLIAAFDPGSLSVWVIPKEELEDRMAIRLGKKWDDWLVPEPRSREYQERRDARRGFLESLREKARGVGEDQKGEFNG